MNNYGDCIRSYDNDKSAKWLSCEVCKYSDDCNTLLSDFDINHVICGGYYKSYKKFLDTDSNIFIHRDKK